MLPQNCSRIHFPLYNNNLFMNKKQNEWGENNYSYNTKNDIDICCFDYLINIEEYYSDNLIQNYFYYQFTKIVYDFDKNNIFDFSNYNIESLIKFIIILSKICCFYYIQDKIKYSKYICNLSVKIIQNHFNKSIININNSNNKISTKNNNIITNDLKINNIISNIYNNACCNYFKTLSFNKASKFLEYSNKNIEENDIYNKLIYYNNALIISTKNKRNYNNIDNYIKLLNKLILTKKKQFDNIYFNNINNGININENGQIKNELKKDVDNYSKFKLLSFIMYNYGFALEYILNQKTQAKKYYQSSYEYISKYLGHNSLEAQKFLFRIKFDKNNKNQNSNFCFLNNNIKGNNILNDEAKKRKNIPGKKIENLNNYDNNIELRLENIVKKIEHFEEILQNKEILNKIIMNENNIKKMKQKIINQQKTELILIIMKLKQKLITKIYMIIMIIIVLILKVMK